MARGEKKLIPPTNLQESQESNNEESWSTNNNSQAELFPPPQYVNHEANGTFAVGPSSIEPYLNEFQESYAGAGVDVTFAPGTPQREPANRTFAPGASAYGYLADEPKSSKKRRREDSVRDGPDMYENLKQIIVNGNMPVQAKMGSLTTIEGLVNANLGNQASLVEEFFIMELGQLLWRHLEPINPICGTILNILSNIIGHGGQDLVKKHVTIPLQKLTEKRDIVNKANALLNRLPHS